MQDQDIDDKKNGPVTDGHYDKPNYNRKKQDPEHDRAQAKTDKKLVQQAQVTNADQKPARNQESGFVGNMDPLEAKQYERTAGYRERYRKIGEGHQNGNESPSFPNYEPEQSKNGSSTLSDASILTDVQKKISENHDIDVSGIEVSIEKGEIGLRGTVDDRKAKRAVESICKIIPGVKSVKNNLKVQPPIGNGLSVGS